MTTITSLKEETIQAHIRDKIRTIDEIVTGSVEINDPDVLQQSFEFGPFVIVMNADGVDSTIRKQTETRFETMVHLYVPFVDWRQSLNEFRDWRTLIFDKFNESEGANRTIINGDGTLNTDATITEIRTVSEVGFDYGRYIPPAEVPDELPLFVWQAFLFVTLVQEC